MKESHDTKANMHAEAQMEPTEGYVQLPEGKLHYLDWGGTGLSAHFLHGNGFCAGTYTPFINFLSHEFHIIASDIRGHGDSMQPSSHRIRHWNVFAEDLKITIVQAMDPPVIGMGHSLGAVATLIAASLHPHLFSSIVLLDPVIFPKPTLWLMAGMKILGLRKWLPMPKIARRRQKVFRDRQAALSRFSTGRGIFKTWSRDFINAYLECGLLEKDSRTAILKCDPELEAQIFESVPLDVWQYMNNISCPVLVIRGEKSDVLSATTAEQLKTVMPSCELSTMEEAGHFVPMEKPRQCAKAISDFIKKHI